MDLVLPLVTGLATGAALFAAMARAEVRQLVEHIKAQDRLIDKHEKRIDQLVSIVTDADPSLLAALEQKRLLPAPAALPVGLGPNEMAENEQALREASTYTGAADLVEVLIPQLSLLQVARLARHCSQHEARLMKMWRKHHENKGA